MTHHDRVGEARRSRWRYAHIFGHGMREKELKHSRGRKLFMSLDEQWVQHARPVQNGYSSLSGRLGRVFNSNRYYPMRRIRIEYNNALHNILLLCFLHNLLEKHLSRPYGKEYPCISAIHFLS